jgi:hypothetical protein
MVIVTEKIYDEKISENNEDFFKKFWKIHRKNKF